MSSYYRRPTFDGVDRGSIARSEIEEYYGLRRLPYAIYCETDLAWQGVAPKRHAKHLTGGGAATLLRRGANHSRFEIRQNSGMQANGVTLYLTVIVACRIIRAYISNDIGEKMNTFQELYGEIPFRRETDFTL